MKERITDDLRSIAKNFQHGGAAILCAGFLIGVILCSIVG